MRSAFGIRLLVVIPFHYSEERFGFLAEAVQAFAKFQVEYLHIVIQTNNISDENLSRIQRLLQQMHPSKWAAERCTGMEHPFLLVWQHKRMIQEFAINHSFSHFIYLEDDMRIDFGNFIYYIDARERLKRLGLIPAFIRTEYSSVHGFYFSTDNIFSAGPDSGEVFCEDELYINPYNPYQACFILDRELAREYLSSRSFMADDKTIAPEYDIRARSAMGLTFENIPMGFKSRYVVPIDCATRRVRLYACIAHLPNNYVHDESFEFGKLPLDQIFYPR